MENIGDAIKTAWIERIAAKMKSEATACAEFTAGTDFKEAELPWIRGTLIPALAPRGMAGSIKMYAKPGDGVGCDCWCSPCDHATGRKFVVTLV